MKRLSDSYFCALRTCSTAILACMCGSVLAQPDEINLTGRLLDADNQPLPGTRAWEVTFFDSAKGGGTLGVPETGVVEVSPTGAFNICVEIDSSLVQTSPLFYEIGIDSATTPDGTVDVADVFPDRIEIKSVMFAQTIVQQGPGSGLDADTLDGMEAAAFLKETELATIIITIDGDGSGIDADQLDGMDADAFVKKTELMTEITSRDGSNSGLDADFLDGLDSGDFVTEEEYENRLGSLVAAPTEVRMLPSSLGPTFRKLTWNHNLEEIPAPKGGPPEPSLAAISGFRVYESQLRLEDFLLPKAEKSGVGGFLDAIATPKQTATNEMDVEVVLNSGLMYYYVTAVSADGRESEPSDPFVLNTTPWVVYRGDLQTDDVFELFAKLPQPGAERLVLSGDSSVGDVNDFAVAPSNHRFAFSSDRTGNEDLFVTEMIRGGVLKGGQFASSSGLIPGGPIQVSSNGPADSIERGVHFSPDSRYLVWGQESEAIMKGGPTSSEQIYSVDLLGLTSIVNGLLPPKDTKSLALGSPVDLTSGFNFSTIAHYTVTPDSRSVIFLAGFSNSPKGIDNGTLYIAPLSGDEPAEPLLFNTPGGLNMYDFALSPDGSTAAFAGSSNLKGGIIVNNPLYLGHIRSGFTRFLGADMFGQRWAPNGNRLFWIYPDFFQPLLPKGAPEPGDMIGFSTIGGVDQVLSLDPGLSISGFEITDDGQFVVFETNFSDTVSPKSTQKLPMTVATATLRAAPASGAGKPDSLYELIVENPIKLPTPVADLQFYLSPDSRTVAILVDDDQDLVNELYFHQIGGPPGSEFEVFPAPGPIKVVAGGPIGPVRFSPDGNIAVFRADYITPDEFDFYSVNVRTTKPVAENVDPVPSMTQGIGSSFVFPYMGYDPLANADGLKKK